MGNIKPASRCRGIIPYDAATQRGNIAVRLHSVVDQVFKRGILIEFVTYLVVRGILPCEPVYRCLVSRYGGRVKFDPDDTAGRGEKGYHVTGSPGIGARKASTRRWPSSRSTIHWWPRSWPGRRTTSSQKCPAAPTLRDLFLTVSHRRRRPFHRLPFVPHVGPEAFHWYGEPRGWLCHNMQ